MVVLCLCHGGHARVASVIAPGKMQSHFAYNILGGGFLDSHVKINLNTQYNYFSCLCEGGLLVRSIRYISVLLCLDMEYR